MSVGHAVAEYGVCDALTVEPVGHVMSLVSHGQGPVGSSRTVPEALEAPIEKGRTVGKVSIFQDDALLNEYEVKAAADASLLTFGGALELLWQCLLGA